METQFTPNFNTTLILPQFIHKEAVSYSCGLRSNLHTAFKSKTDTLSKSTMAQKQGWKQQKMKQQHALSLTECCHESCKQEKGVAHRSNADTKGLILTKPQNMPGES